MKRLITNAISRVINEKWFKIYFISNIIYVILLTIYNNVLLSKFSVDDWYNIITYNVVVNTLFLIGALAFTIIGAIFIGICLKDMYNAISLEEDEIISLICESIMMIFLSIFMIVLTISCIYIPLLKALLIGGAFTMTLLACTNN